MHFNRFYYHVPKADITAAAVTSTEEEIIYYVVAGINAVVVLVVLVVLVVIVVIVVVVSIGVVGLADCIKTPSFGRLLLHQNSVGSLQTSLLGRLAKNNCSAFPLSVFVGLQYFLLVLLLSLLCD